MPMDPGSRVADKAITFKGLRSGLPVESIGIDSAEELKNFLLKDGQLKKQNGSAFYGPGGADVDHMSAYGGGIKSLHRFKKLWVAQRANAIGVEPTEAAAGFAVVNSSELLTSQNKLYSTNWRDRIFFTNAIDASFVLSTGPGTALAPNYKYGQLGLDAPPKSSAAFFEPAEGSTGNIVDGTYYYLFTLFDERTNTESPAYGACLAADGLYELSPNGELGPTPVEQVVSSGPSIVNITGAVTGLCAYFAFFKPSHFPRATHFIMYRAAAKVGDLYNSFFRVPLKNGGEQDGAVYINIDAFVAEGLDFVDNTATADLEAVSLPENNSPPPTPRRATLANTQAISRGMTSQTISADDCSGFRHIRIFRDQLFGLGAKAPGYNVEEVLIGDSAQKTRGTINDFSDILYGSEVYQPDYFPYIWEVGRGDGQESVGLGVLGDVALLCFKEKSAYYLTGSSPADYVLRIMDTQKGAIHQSVIQETPAGVITLDRSGFVLWNKIGQGERISKQIQDVIDRILFEYSATFYSYYNPQESQYVCAVVVDAGTTPNLTLTLDLDSMEWSTSKGIEGLSRMADTDSDGTLVDIMGAVSTGRIVNFASERNVTFNNGAIEGIWKSGTINFGDDQRKKKMQWLYIRAKSASSWKVDIEVIPDYDESRKYVLDNWDVVSSQSTWYSSDIATDGSLIWEEGTWATDGKVRQVSKVPIKCIGYTFQVRIIHRETDTERYGFTIESVSAEAVKFGR